MCVDDDIKELRQGGMIDNNVKNKFLLLYKKYFINQYHDKICPSQKHQLLCQWFGKRPSHDIKYQIP